MTCMEAQEQIVAYLDGETSPLSQEEIETHLIECSPCREEADLLKVTSALVRSEPLLEPSASWELSLEQKLASAKWKSLSEEVRTLQQTVVELNQRLRRQDEAEATEAAKNDLMTAEEVAVYLRMPTEKVYEMLDDLPHIEMGYILRFRRSSIDQWLSMREVRPATDEFAWSDWIAGTPPHLTS